MKFCTSKPLQQIVVLTLVFKMRSQTTKSIKKFLRSCFARVALIANKKCSGIRVEVSGSRVVGRAGVGKGDTATYIGVCSVIVDAFGNVFLHVSNLRIFDAISARSPLNMSIMKILNCFSPKKSSAFFTTIY